MGRKFIFLYLVYHYEGKLIKTSCDFRSLNLYIKESNISKKELLKTEKLNLFKKKRVNGALNGVLQTWKSKSEVKNV